MDAVLKAALLLNASRAPLSALEKLRADDACEVFAAGASQQLWSRLGLRDTTCAVLAKLFSEPNWPEAEAERTEKLGARFITACDTDYPKRLLDLPSPPVGLYVLGTLPSSSFSVAVVGTRRCSFYGRTAAGDIARALARAGCVTVSGGARGIDTAAHKGALNAGGLTAAVLGTGIDRVYPVENRDLFAEIASHGALISEYPIGSGGAAWRFPDRNRIIVGLASRTVVAESPRDGGAMISARLAIDIGREVWCVPGQIYDETCAGSNALLSDGALPLVDIPAFIKDISGRYGQLVLDLDIPDDAPQQPPRELTGDEETLMNILSRQGNRTADDLLAESGLDFVTVQTCLMSLSADGLIAESGMGRWSAKR